MTLKDNLQSIGFIGLGLMGAPMAKRYINAGFTVSLWNRSQNKVAPFRDLGVRICESIDELTSSSDILMLCVSDTKAVEQIVFGEDGISNYAGKEKIVVDFSSIDPTATKNFAQRLFIKNGIKWVDAPVSGGVVGAESGNLVIMAGGDKSTLENLRPVLGVISNNVTRMGPVGSGQMTKVCNQIIVSCNVLVMAEVLAMAEKAGVESTKIPDALKGGFADSIPLQLTGKRMVNKDFGEIKWHVKTLLKDLSLAKDLNESVDAYSPMTDLAKRLMQKYVDDGYGELDPSNLINAYMPLGQKL